MDSKVNAATWALDRGVSVVICNGTQDKAIKTIIAGRKVGTFFTETAAGGPTPVDMLAENGKDVLCNLHGFSFLYFFFFGSISFKFGVSFSTFQATNFPRQGHSIDSLK